MRPVATTKPGSHPRMPDPELAPGTVVGDYQIERQIGVGGMGTVYQAIHPVIDKRVALKVLRYEMCANAESLGRFVQEARAVNRIGHPNIVDVFGFGTTEDGRAFLAMELLTGESLGVRLASGRFTLAEACAILIEITHALEAAHDADVIHRDLKPDNIFLAVRKSETIVKLLDFGIAKLSPVAGMQAPVDITQPGQLVGTPQYIAPEQARGLVVERSADVYALGVVAFEMMTGWLPFTSTDPVELLAKHITLRAPLPSDFEATLPPLVDDLIASMLEKEPAKRPTVPRVRELLEQIRIAPSALTGRAAKRQFETAVLDTHALSDKTGPRRRWWLAPLVLMVIAGGIKLATTLFDRADQGAHEDHDDAPRVTLEAPVPGPLVTPTAPVPSAPEVIATAPPPELAAKPLAKPLAKPVKPNPHKHRPGPAATVTAPTTVPTVQPPPVDDDGIRNPFKVP